MTAQPTDEISWKDHMKDMAEFEPYLEFLEDQTEFEMVVKWLMECPHLDYLSKEFQQALFKEVRAQVEWFKENAVIKEKKHKETVVERSYKYMEYKDEY